MKTTTMTTKRIIAFLLMFVLACGAVFALSGCQSKEQQAQDALKGFLEDYKNGSSELFTDQDSDDLSQLGLDPAELVSVMTEGFSYDIKGAKEDSSKNVVNVEVTVHSKQLTEAIVNVFPDMISYAFSASLSQVSEADMQKEMTKMILDQLRQEEPIESTVTVAMVEESGSWEMTDAGELELTNAIMGNMQELQSRLNAAAASAS